MMTWKEKVEGRIKAAIVNGGASAATPRGDGRFTVRGRAGDRYTVVTFGLGAMVRCDCKAGIHDVPCWHAAAVYLLMVASSMH
jgi:hypothetical protein